MKVAFAHVFQRPPVSPSPAARTRFCMPGDASGHGKITSRFRPGWRMCWRTYPYGVCASLCFATWTGSFTLLLQTGVLHLQFAASLPARQVQYHYTDAGGLHGILDNIVFWATKAAYLIDSQESSTACRGFWRSCRPGKACAESRTPRCCSEARLGRSVVGPSNSSAASRPEAASLHSAAASSSTSVADTAANRSTVPFASCQPHRVTATLRWHDGSAHVANPTSAFAVLVDPLGEVLGFSGTGDVCEKGRCHSRRDCGLASCWVNETTYLSTDCVSSSGAAGPRVDLFSSRAAGGCLVAAPRDSVLRTYSRMRAAACAPDRLPNLNTRVRFPSSAPRNRRSERCEVQNSQVVVEL